MGTSRVTDPKARLKYLENRRVHVYDAILILLDQIALLEHEMDLCKSRLNKEME